MRMKFNKTLIKKFSIFSCLRCLAAVYGRRMLCEPCVDELPWIKNCSNLMIFSAFYYQPPIDHWITQFKFSGNLRDGRLLTELCYEALLAQHDSAWPELLIPVPLHQRRLQERGFNQAVEIAKPLGKRLKIPVVIHSCQRIKNTKPQSELSGKERIHNVSAAFAITKPINARHVAIIDDVITTGNTVQSLSLALQEHGITTIEVWSIAKTKMK